MPTPANRLKLVLVYLVILPTYAIMQNFIMTGWGVSVWQVPENRKFPQETCVRNALLSAATLARDATDCNAKMTVNCEPDWVNRYTIDVSG
jgi:hypothetical protein